MAHVLALQAQDDASKVGEAIKALADFKAEYPNGWQVVPALLELGRLQEDAGKTDDARKTYEQLADLAGVPKETRQESELLVGRLLLRAGKAKDAEARLLKLRKGLSREDPQLPFVLAYLAWSRMGQRKLDGVEGQLKEALKASRDGRLRGLAYNLLGDYYRAKGKLEDAFWSYLRVDAQYNDDREEQAKALYHLRKLYDKPKNDPVRAKDCAARLLGKAFNGTVYQRMAKGEKK
jgi:tetratricopeptide (TPR) repeat protein